LALRKADDVLYRGCVAKRATSSEGVNHVTSAVSSVGFQRHSRLTQGQPIQAKVPPNAASLMRYRINRDG
jgi:hypothetical protein